MSATKISLEDFATEFMAITEGAVEQYGLHPTGAAVISQWIGEMGRAAEIDDAAEVKRLARMMVEKFKQEHAKKTSAVGRASPQMAILSLNPAPRFGP